MVLQERLHAMMMHIAHRTCASIQIVRSRVTCWLVLADLSAVLVLFLRWLLHAPALDLHSLEHYVGHKHAFSDPRRLVQFIKIHR
jgi:hypothetical protein